MVTYYNKSKGPLPLVLRASGSTVVPPKSYVTLSEEDAGSEKVVFYVNRGQLVKMPTLPEPATVEVKEAESSDSEIKPVPEKVPVEQEYKSEEETTSLEVASEDAEEQSESSEDDNTDSEDEGSSRRRRRRRKVSSK